METIYSINCTWQRSLLLKDKMYKEQMHKEKEEKLKQENKKRKTVSNI